MRKSAVIFPGQGAQYVGMGQELFSSARAQAIIKQANDVLGFDLQNLCLNGPIEDLTLTKNSQCAIFTMGYIAYSMLQDALGENWRPAYAAGLSLGEFTALAAAEVFDFEDGLRLVQQRGQFMMEACEDHPGGMASIMGADRDAVKTLVDTQARAGQKIAMANLNCPGQIVVSGEKSAVEACAKSAEEQGYRAILLNVSGAFHSPLMESARKKLSDAVNSIPMRAPVVPVIANCDARPKTTVEQIKQAVITQMVSPVLWEDSVKYIIAQGVDMCIEPGCGKVLRGLMRRIDRSTACISVETGADIESVVTQLCQEVS